MKITKKLLESLNLGFKFPAQKTKWYAELDDFDCVEIEVFSEKQYKTLKQNNLFHSLLNIFWESGVSSFFSYFAMRLFYKRFAGLVKYKYENDLQESTKTILWNFVKATQFEQGEKEKVIELLKGRVLEVDSWSDVTKENATRTIDQLMRDMDEAGVLGTDKGKKYEEVLKGIGDWYED